MLSEARHLGRVAVFDMDVRGLATRQAGKRNEIEARRIVDTVRHCSASA